MNINNNKKRENKRGVGGEIKNRIKKEIRIVLNENKYYLFLRINNIDGKKDKDCIRNNFVIIGDIFFGKESRGAEFI